MQARKIERVYPAKATMEGAGVRLHRGFGYFEVPKFDPFLLFDDFSSVNENDYLAGFPEHPHRGIETVTYILKGEVRHKDSIGNEGSIKNGEIQWMTAGSGIVHEEMPQHSDEGLQGFQLWVNLPKKDKMMHPRYQEIKADEIPVVEHGNSKVRVIAGKYQDHKGPVKDLMVAPTYLDVTLAANTPFVFETPFEHNFFLYVIESSLSVGNEIKQRVVLHDIAHTERGEVFTCTSEKEGARFLLVGGKPIGEPVAWRGPIVMNTDDELEVAFAEYRTGTFIKDVD
jgi:hypothetical protein